MESPNSLVRFLIELFVLTIFLLITLTFCTCVSFPTVLAIYPGYYTGRATHVHAKVFPEWTVIKENNTYKAGRLSHVGQFFFDEELNMVIDKVRTTLYLQKIRNVYTSHFIAADVSLCHESHKGHYRPHAEHTRLAEYI